MSEIAELTVLINGDISGLTDAVNKAQAEIESISSYAEVGYGDGKFSNARTRYNGWVNSGNRSVDDRIGWWREAMKAYSYDKNVYWEARRNIYELSRERALGANDIAKSYIKHMDYFGSAQNGTDRALGTFGEFKNLNSSFLDKGLINSGEYGKFLYDFGKELYEGRLELSEKWLKKEEKYNDLSADGYIDGLKRIEAYTDEYYANGLISYSEYAKARESIQNALIDKTREKYAAEYANWENDADSWYKMRETYGDWNDFGDSPTEFFGRKATRISEFYSAGKISFEEYVNAANGAKMDLYSAYSDEYDSMLAEYASVITKQKEAFSKQEQALKDSWTVADRRVNMGNLRRDISFYENSVTERGKEKLADLKTELRDEERSQKLYELQQKNSAVIEKMQTGYEIMERNKSDALKNVVASSANLVQIEAGIQSAINSARASIESTNTVTYRILENIYGAIKGMSFGNSYTDSRNINISSAVSRSDIMKAIDGSFVSGLGKLSYNGKVY